MSRCQVFSCYNNEGLEQESNSNDETQQPDKQPLTVGKIPPTAPPVNPIEPLPQSPIVQQDIGTSPPHDPSGYDETENRNPMPVTVVNDPLLTRVIEDDALGVFERTTLRYARFLVAAITLLVVVGTAVVFWDQFREMSNQTDLLAIAATQARRDAKDA